MFSTAYINCLISEKTKTFLTSMLCGIGGGGVLAAIMTPLAQIYFQPSQSVYDDAYNGYLKNLPNGTEYSDLVKAANYAYDEYDKAATHYNTIVGLFAFMPIAAGLLFGLAYGIYKCINTPIEERNAGLPTSPAQSQRIFSRAQVRPQISSVSLTSDSKTPDVSLSVR